MSARVAIVTGSASGIGAATVLELSRRGWRVVINYSKSVDAANKVAAQCSDAMVVQADVGLDGECRRLAQAALDQWGRIDALVNNAGATKFVPHPKLDELTDEDFLRIYRVNVVAAFQMTRESCSQGLCGCCTVLVNGKAVSGCLFLAAFVDGAEVVTVEHLAGAGRLNPVQEALIESGGFQCGFCTPGFVLMGNQLLDRYPDATDDEIRHYLSGNLCRCAAYPEIIEAVKIAARKRGSPGGNGHADTTARTQAR